LLFILAQIVAAMYCQHILQNMLVCYEAVEIAVFYFFYYYCMCL